MPKRSRSTVGSSDESDIEPEASFKPEPNESDVPDNGVNAASPKQTSDSEDDGSSRFRSRRRRLRLSRQQDNEMQFPVVLKVNENRIFKEDNETQMSENKGESKGRRRTRNQTMSDQDDWMESSENLEESSAGEEDEEFEYSDGGFVVDSDDNMVKKRTNRWRRKTNRRGPGRPRITRRTRRTRAKVNEPSESDDEFTASDASLAEELRELQGDSLKKRGRNYRVRAPVNYAIPPPPTIEEVARQTQKESESIAAAKAKGDKPRRLFDVRGPFGGHDVDTIFELKRSELEAVLQRDICKPKEPPGNGKYQFETADRAANNADIDPVDVAEDVDFSMVGGLDNYIAKLKEMVSLPLLYPELYEKFGITPPRGVLFHGPPGTGKTLMARALAASHKQEKVTFYMRKGADVLSKWIGESERQLRALFEEAQANQPSIIFFDEIDGLAPVRSAKQEQHHASIVSTLLALMDGMDNRGQVVVIGATNRPDSVDPALRRPGRFDREFYFPLPDLEARKTILEIHTRKWNPPLTEKFKEEIALQTKGFGGADIRALATEAALLAIQRSYPQIYDSKAKLQVNSESIEVRQQDFAVALERIQPSTVRAAGASLAQPLPARIEPLLRKTMNEIRERIEAVFPREPRNTTIAELFLDEPQFEQARQIKQFVKGRVHRPRMLLRGTAGNGQAYLNKAVAYMMEGVYVRELSTTSIFEPSAGSLSPEATIVSAVSEARQHTPACIVLPRVREWHTVPHMDALLTGLLRSLLPSEQVFVVGTADDYPDLDEHQDEQGPALLHYFGMDVVNIQLDLSESVIAEFFAPILDFIKRSPSQCLLALEFPRKPQPKLEKAPVIAQALEPVPATNLTKQSNAVYSDSDRAELRVRSQLKLKLGIILDGFRQRYRRFRKPIIDEKNLVHLFEKKIEYEKLRNSESSEHLVDSADTDISDHLKLIAPERISNSQLGTDDGNEAVIDLSEVNDNVELADEEDDDFEYVRTKDDMILEKSSGKKYYNMDLETIEDRLWNGFYCEPQQFLDDITMIYQDTTVHGERERMHKASEMLANAQVAIDDISIDKAFIASCQELHRKDAEYRLNEMALSNGKQLNIKEHEPADDSKELPFVPSNGNSNILPDAEVLENENKVITNGSLESILNHDDTCIRPTTVDVYSDKKVHYDVNLYDQFVHQLFEIAQSRTLDELELLYSSLSDVAWQFRQEWNRIGMIQALISQLNS